MLTWTQTVKSSGANAKLLEGTLKSLFTLHDVKSLDKLGASLLKLGDKIHKHDVIVMGNFNALNISWDNLKASANLSFPSKKSIELTHEYNLVQFIKEPTRQQGNLSNTMDLVLLNHSNIICNFNCIIINQQS